MRVLLRGPLAIFAVCTKLLTPTDTYVFVSFFFYYG